MAVVTGPQIPSGMLLLATTAEPSALGLQGHGDRQDDGRVRRYRPGLFLLPRGLDRPEEMRADRLGFLGVQAGIDTGPAVGAPRDRPATGRRGAGGQRPLHPGVTVRAGPAQP